jgi:hypothetical protein
MLRPPRGLTSMHAVFGNGNIDFADFPDLRIVISI